uniref:Myb/SANT-like domain-containing protein n=1 Tax=Fagus sylvatica TaxID=28930 RepID=A0A2N9EE18_FAGSY
MGTGIYAREDAKLWPARLEKLFIDIMVEEMHKGNMPMGIFKLKTWCKILEELNLRSKQSFKLKQVKAKYNRLKQKYRVFSQLLQQNGFVWHGETNSVTASDEVWESYLYANPDAERFREKGCEHYKLLGILFNKLIAMGFMAFASTQDAPDTDEERELDEAYRNGAFIDVDSDSQDDHEKKVSQKRTKRSGKCPMRSEAKGRKRSRKADEFSELNDAIRAFAEQTKLMLEAKVARMKEKEKRKQQRDEFSIPNCVNALESLGDLDMNTYTLAIKKFSTAEWREAFMSLSSNARKKAWLDCLK